MASKTARRSSPTMSKNPTPAELIGAAATSATKRIIPMNGGKHCRIPNPVTRLSPHLATDSPEFTSTLAEMADASEAMADRLRSELNDLAETSPDSEWPKVRDAAIADGGPLGAKIADSEEAGASDDS